MFIESERRVMKFDLKEDNVDGGFCSWLGKKQVFFFLLLNQLLKQGLCD